MFDMLEDNSFSLVGGFSAALRLSLSLRDSNLVFEVMDETAPTSPR